MKVVALEHGFDGICVREKGEVFEWPHPEPGAWMKTVEHKNENVAETHNEQKPEKEKGKKRKNDQEID